MPAKGRIKDATLRNVNKVICREFTIAWNCSLERSLTFFYKTGYLVKSMGCEINPSRRQGCLRSSPFCVQQEWGCLHRQLCFIPVENRAQIWDNRFIHIPSRSDALAPMMGPEPQCSLALVQAAYILTASAKYDFQSLLSQTSNKWEENAFEERRFGPKGRLSEIILFAKRWYNKPARCKFSPAITQAKPNSH